MVIRKKRCSACRTLKPRKAFSAAHREKDGLQYRCKDCHKKYQRKHCASIKKFLRKEKNKPCTDCGRKYPWYIMDFDHVRGVKRFDISRVVQRQISHKKILKEISKCEIVCANCHRTRTFKRGYNG